MYLEEQPIVPYETLRYLIATINYGGRVTDDKDEILIRAILKGYVCEDVMNRGYEFSESGNYKVPASLDLEDVKSYIDSLPANDKPEVFGLHDNANITFEINRVKLFINTLVECQPKVVSGGKSGGSNSR